MHVRVRSGRRRAQHLRALAQLLRDARALVDEVERRATARSHLFSTSGVAQPLLHRQLRDAQVLRRHAVGRVADDERDVGALGGALRAQRRVVLDRLVDLRLAAHAGGVDDHDRAVPSTSAAGRSRRASSPRRPRRSRARLRAKRLTSEDLPTFGRPITARRIVSSSLARRPRRAASSTIRSSRSPVPSPCAAETAIGSPRPRRWNSAASHVVDRVALVRGDQHRRPARRSRSAISSSPGPDAGPGVDDEHRDVGVGEPGARLVTDRPASGSASAKSTPPVSISVKSGRSTRSRAPCGRA